MSNGDVKTGGEMIILWQVESWFKEEYESGYQEWLNPKFKTKDEAVEWSKKNKYFYPEHPDIISPFYAVAVGDGRGKKEYYRLKLEKYKLDRVRE